MSGQDICAAKRHEDASDQLLCSKSDEHGTTPKHQGAGQDGHGTAHAELSGQGGTPNPDNSAIMATEVISRGVMVHVLIELPRGHRSLKSQLTGGRYTPQYGYGQSGSPTTTWLQGQVSVSQRQI